MSFVIIYITFPNEKEAKRITEELISKRLIACSNMFPMQSSYRWKGKVQSSDEIVAIVKTRTDNWKKVEEEIKRLHPYEVPCIIRFDVGANPEFEEWIQDETE